MRQTVSVNSSFNRTRFSSNDNPFLFDIFTGAFQSLCFSQHLSRFTHTSPQLFEKKPKKLDEDKKNTVKRVQKKKCFHMKSHLLKNHIMGTVKSLLWEQRAVKWQEVVVVEGALFVAQASSCILRC